MWVKQNVASDDANLIWLGGDGKRIMLKTTDSYPSWDETSNNMATDNISLNQWHHLAFVVEDANLTHIYIDGIPSTINNSTPIEIPTGFNIASFYGTTDVFESNFEGIMDELRYWNTARTQSEINANKDQELTGNEIGLKAYWNFNDGSGNRLTDVVGIADGTLFNMEEEDWVSDTPFGGTNGINSLNKTNLSLNIFPNPFSTETSIRFNVTDNSNIQLEIFDLTGKKINQLIKTNLNKGIYTINYLSYKLKTGVYICKLTQGNRVSTKKLIVNQ
jgi:hypothetical protein